MRRKHQVRDSIWIRWALFFVILGVYGVYILLCYAQVPLNSDWASFILEADEMLSGNGLLRGWTFTGATFYLTEIPFYLLGTALAGVTPWAGILAGAAMIVAMVAVGWLLVFQSVPAQHGKRWEWKWLALGSAVYFAVGGFPNSFAVESLRAHVGVFAFSLGAFFCLFQSFHSDRWLIGYFLLLTLGALSDLFIFPVVFLPVVLIALVDCFSSEQRVFPRPVRVMVVTVAALLVGILLEKGFLWLNGNALNGRLEYAAIVLWSNFSSAFALFLNLLFRLNDADFFGEPLASVSTMILVIRAGLVLWGLVLMVATLVHWRKKRGADRVSLLISLSFFTLSLWVIFVGFIDDSNSARYISCFPVMLAVLLSRRILAMAKKQFKFLEKSISVGLCAACLALVLGLSAIHPVSLQRTVSAQDRLAAFLQENQLTSGYADFWNANLVTVSAKNKVQVRAIRADLAAETPCPYLWFSKSSWYNDPRANFVLVKKAGFGSGYMKITERNIVRQFGAPLQRLDFEETRVLVYPEGALSMQEFCR